MVSILELTDLRSASLVNGLYRKVASPIEQMNMMLRFFVLDEGLFEDAMTQAEEDMYDQYDLSEMVQ